MGSDLWLLAQRVGNIVELHFKATSLTFAIQDGPAAGQTVSHVHIHVLPRKSGDFEPKDKIYDHLERDQKNVKMDAMNNRRRTSEEMTAEANILRTLLQESFHNKQNEHVSDQIKQKPSKKSEKSYPPTQPFVKICGVKDIKAAQTATQAGAHMIGLIFVKKSKRYVEPSQAQQI